MHFNKEVLIDLSNADIQKRINWRLCQYLYQRSLASDCYKLPYCTCFKYQKLESMMTEYIIRYSQMWFHCQSPKSIYLMVHFLFVRAKWNLITQLKNNVMYNLLLTRSGNKLEIVDQWSTRIPPPHRRGWQWAMGGLHLNIVQNHKAAILKAT